METQMLMTPYFQSCRDRGLWPSLLKHMPHSLHHPHHTDLLLMTTDGSPLHSTQGGRHRQQSSKYNLSRYHNLLMTAFQLPILVLLVRTDNLWCVYNGDTFSLPLYTVVQSNTLSFFFGLLPSKEQTDKHLSHGLMCPAGEQEVG